MPELKLGCNRDSWSSVLRAFESEAGLPQGDGGNRDWLDQLISLVNEKNETDLAYTRENYGYWFQYNRPKSATLLAKMKEKYRL